MLLAIMAHPLNSTDILLTVCSNVPAADKTTVLRVHKRLQQIAQSRLYADLYLRWRIPNFLFDSPPYVLLSRVVTAHAIASHVEHC